MSTNTRPELSEKNPYWIDRHRYYELKHFCLQYPMWKKIYESFDGSKKNHDLAVKYSETNIPSDPTADYAVARAFYSKRMKLVEKAAAETDEHLANYILKAVTEGLTYDHLKAQLNIPCGKDYYYNLYRRFFWLLSRMRG